jgi:cholesterol transport system auxiliary component
VKNLLGSLSFSTLLLLSAGCVDLSRPALAKHYYLLETSPKPSDAPPAQASAIRVTGVEVAAPFSERSMVYRLDQERYESDFYNEYFVAPRAMITSKLVEWLSVRRVFATTLPPSSTLDAPYAIEGQVTALYGDRRDTAKTAAVFGMQVFVTDSLGPDKRIVLERACAQQVPVPDRSADAISKGLSQALQQCFAEIEADLRALKLNP